MKIIGLTGGIGMGKSTVAKMFEGYGFLVYDADAAVHAVLKKGGSAVKPVAALFPEALKRGGIDRAALARTVFGDAIKLKKLESLIHPLIRKEEKAVIARARKAKAKAVFLDIPLLFETGGDARCDEVLCVYAARAVQKNRVLSRAGMTEERLKSILARQMPITEKKRRSDYVIRTDKSLHDTALSVAAFVDGLCPLSEKKPSLRAKPSAAKQRRAHR